MGKTFHFGRDDRLVGAITVPRSTQARDVGLVVWGLGLAELRAVKHLSSLPLVSMQVDKRDRNGQSLRAVGVELCREAVNELEERHGVERFILMGMCATASICLKTALVDSRIVGVILVNPHISEKLAYWPTVLSRCLSWASWRRVFMRRAHVGPHFRKAFLVTLAMISKRFAERQSSVVIATYGDTAAPEDFKSALVELSARGVETLLVCSEDDYSLHYFWKVYGKDLAELRLDPNVSLDILSSAPHNVSSDVATSETMGGIIARWVRQTKVLAC